MTNQANLIQLLRRIPPKWALMIVGFVLTYWLCQPVLNRILGWNLPSIASLVGETETRTQKPTTESQTKAKQEVTKQEVTQKEVAKPITNESQPTDFLEEVGPDRFRSPAGLMYNRGSEEGHRLKHLARHLEDQPTRPGSHGVFSGDLTQALKWIDEAYQKAKKGDRAARTHKDGESTVYEVTFEKSIGYIGGSDGKRKGNPSTKRLRIVVIGQNVITAFPF